MNRARVAELLRELADEIEDGDASVDGVAEMAATARRLHPRPANEVRVDDVTRAKARRALRRLGEPT